MKFWRMQLHPSDSAQSVSHTMRSLGLGYIGLDFADPPGDLTDVDRESIPVGQRDYCLFVNVGGLAYGLRNSMIAELKSAGFVAGSQTNPALQGLDADNICNRGSEKQGLQLEISRGLRDLLVTDQQQMDCFSSTVRSALHGL